MIDHEKNTQTVSYSNGETHNASMKVLIGEKEGWKDHVMRIIELGIEGHSPLHSHPWPHINYIISGRGVLQTEGQDAPLEKGSYAFVPDNTLHQFKNTGKEPLRFICIVPRKGHIA